ncbi:MAG: hypothetical protein WCJ81_09065 [bacterium]
MYPQIDPKYIDQIMNESWHTTQPKNVIKLPCGHEQVEAEIGHDEYIECGTCKKKYLLNWQKYSKPKIYGQND